MGTCIFKFCREFCMFKKIVLGSIMLIIDNCLVKEKSYKSCICECPP